MTRRIQRVMRGMFGRRKRDRVLAALALAKMKWNCAKQIQRIIRGHLGRVLYAKLLFEMLQETRRWAATEIQRQFRGYRGRVLGAVARAIHLLRKKHAEAAFLLQRVVRGHFGRMRAKTQKETVMRWAIEKRSSTQIQRLFRGHKGREAAVIERELQAIEHKVKPLLLMLETKEAEEVKLARVIVRLEYTDSKLESELVEIERELDACMLTTAKYTDSARVNSTPQRYLTKYLRVRLKDHYEHEREIFKVKHTELNKRRVEMRELQKHIAAVRRELVPLTTGAVVEIKRKRSAALRSKIRDRDKHIARIQALFRRSLVRWAFSDPCRDYWIECFDPEQSESKYFYNTWSQETTWKMPLAFKYFVKWKNEPRSDRIAIIRKGKPKAIEDAKEDETTAQNLDEDSTSTAPKEDENRAGRPSKLEKSKSNRSVDSTSTSKSAASTTTGSTSAAGAGAGGARRKSKTKKAYDSDSD
jgi:hypothetical protein